MARTPEPPAPHGEEDEAREIKDVSETGQVLLLLATIQDISRPLPYGINE